MAFGWKMSLLALLIVAVISFDQIDAQDVKERACSNFSKRKEPASKSKHVPFYSPRDLCYASVTKLLRIQPMNNNKDQKLVLRKQQSKSKYCINFVAYINKEKLCTGRTCGGESAKSKKKMVFKSECFDGRYEKRVNKKKAETVNENIDNELISADKE